jgi:predicted nucleotide-binding protein (sugar kinase/HSP70/actin superfamily)
VIGIPRALLYHKYHALWSAFFEGIGCKTVLSPPTNRRILSRGVELAVDESCLSMKVFLGHVDSLRGRCDYVLVPRLESVDPREHMCVKFMGAYDIVRNTLPDLRLVMYDVDVANGLTEQDAFVRLGRSLGAGRLRARRAYREASAASRAHELELAREQEAIASAPADRPRILVVGHTYNLADELIGQPLLRYLRSLDVDVLVSDAVDHDHARSLSSRLSPTIRWTYNKELLGAIALYRAQVDGIVFVITFPCGPDSLMSELCCRRIDGIPVATLVIDELSGEAGLRTRLESFCDIIAAKRAKSQVRLVST